MKVLVFIDEIGDDQIEQLTDTFGKQSIARNQMRVKGVSIRFQRYLIRKRHRSQIESLP